MRTGPSFWIAVKTTRQCQIKPDFQTAERQLTLDDARKPALPWLPAGEVPSDYEDIEYASSWTRGHAPERPQRDQHKKV
jgi:hypothetical protein